MTVASPERVLLGMSGGTDSSVSALLLQEAGYEVTGVTFRFFEPHNDTTYLDEATALAEKLNIHHIIYDVRQAFEQQIIGHFIDEYLSGHTPFPCVRCNNTFKWPLLEKIADEQGIFHIATGHYARVVQQKGRFYIAAGNDPDKDQSFFLWGLRQELLQRALFPLGHLHKKEVRALAAQKGFTHIANKKDSMGICFCPEDYRDFLQSRLVGNPIESGHFVDNEGNILGKHRGYPFYTIGQRRGLVHLNRVVFVKEITPDTNRVTLSPLDELYKNRLYLKEVNLPHPDEIPAVVDCRIRYRKQQSRCRITRLSHARAIVELCEPEHSVAPGQSAVFYHAGCVLGGGIIDNAE